jgi:hypothetical protein
MIKRAEAKSTNWVFQFLKVGGVYSKALRESLEIKIKSFEPQTKFTTFRYDIYPARPGGIMRRAFKHRSLISKG